MTSPFRSGKPAVAAMLGAAGLLLVLDTWTASIGPGHLVTLNHHRQMSSEQAASTTGSTPGRNVLEELSQSGVGGVRGWVGVVILLVVVPLLAVLVLLAARVALTSRLRRMSGPGGRLQPPGEDVSIDGFDLSTQVTVAVTGYAENQRALLSLAGEPRNAIVATWHRFEEQLVLAGVPRLPWQTTSEFLLDVLRRVGADMSAVSRLADLYLEARFSDHPMTEIHRRWALEALDALERSLRPETFVTRA